MADKQTILIAGATGNVGGGAATALAQRGARVVLLGRRLEHWKRGRIRSVRLCLRLERTIGTTTSPRWSLISRTWKL